MTYNWNTMVEITVPTGTNGWLYSGEVIINGVKVRFPVGTPTSVPEPAAVLLKKMIELEQEEDANTAKPQNHYVGSVTIPAGKTLTLEEGAMVNDMAGGLGGGSASAGGGGVLVINMSCDLSDDMSTVTNPTKDKTFAEAKAVYDAGGIVVVRLECKSGPMAGYKFDFERTAFMVMGGQSGFMFTMNNAAGPNMINLLSDDSFNIMID